MYRVDGKEGDDAVPFGALVGAEAEALGDGAGEVVDALDDLGGGVGLAGDAAGVGVAGLGGGVAAVAVIVHEFVEGDVVGDVCDCQ